MGRRYRYVGPTEIQAAVGESGKGTVISSPDDLLTFSKENELESDADGLYWVTYIVDKD